MTGEELGHLMELLLDKGVKDVYYTPIYMKKNRPAVILTCIIESSIKEEILKIIFKHSTSLGVRIAEVDRVIMDRKIEKKKTKYGEVAYKYSRYKDIEKKSVEYEDLKRISKSKDISINKLYNELLWEDNCDN